MSDNIKKFVEAVANEKYADAKDVLGAEFKEKFDARIATARGTFGLRLEKEIDIVVKDDDDDDKDDEGKKDKDDKKDGGGKKKFNFAKKGEKPGDKDDDKEPDNDADDAKEKPEDEGGEPKKKFNFQK